MCLPEQMQIKSLRIGCRNSPRAIEILSKKQLQKSAQKQMQRSPISRCRKMYLPEQMQKKSPRIGCRNSPGAAVEVLSNKQLQKAAQKQMKRSPINRCRNMYHPEQIQKKSPRIGCRYPPGAVLDISQERMQKSSRNRSRYLPRSSGRISLQKLVYVEIPAPPPTREAVEIHQEKRESRLHDQLNCRSTYMKGSTCLISGEFASFRSLRLTERRCG